MWTKGTAANDIGKMLGISRNAVIGKAHRLKLPARPSPIKLAKQGKKPEAKKVHLPKEVPSVQAAPPAKEPESEPDCGLGISIVELNERVCQWPYGDPRDSDFHYCGRPVKPGLPYCARHAGMAYQAPSSRRGDDDKRAGKTR